MNQLSGKITRFFYVGFDRNFFIHQRGHKTPNRAGGLCMNFSGSTWNNPLAVKSYLSSFPVQLIPEAALTQFYIVIKYRKHFYRAWNNRFQTGNSYIMKNSEIPFEFLVQPALPCFAHIVPTSDNNISFQQTISGEI